MIFHNSTFRLVIILKKYLYDNAHTDTHVRSCFRMRIDSGIATIEAAKAAVSVQYSKFVISKAGYLVQKF